MIFGLALGLPIALSLEATENWIGGKHEGIIVGIGFGLIGALYGGLSNSILVRKPVWSLKRFLTPSTLWHVSRAGFLGSIACGVVFGLIGATSRMLESGHSLLYQFQVGLSGGLIFGLVFGLIFGAAFGLIKDMEQTIKPIKVVAADRWIWKSLGNALVFGLLGVLLGGLLCLPIVKFFQHTLGAIVNWEMLTINFHLISELTTKREVRLYYGIITGAVISLYFFIPCVQHLALRLVLTGRRHMPLRYNQFLATAASRVLLLYSRNGSYEFAHGLLRDHFAAIQSPARYQTVEAELR